MAHVSHKLKTSFEGALAGGGDPATSPLYVFGPFLKLIVVAGVAQVTFGASVWLVVLTIAIVSSMYRLVMQWVTDGSGGSGLSEEEFGSWAVKVNAAITFIEYTLTFLVSMAAMVTFIADRIPVLNDRILWIQYRTIVAIALSVLTGWLVNRGPRMAARAFGPATAGVLLLLWTMIIATIWKFGFNLPSFNWEAFSPQYLEFTMGGFVRILAVMTGIEVFANLVAAYSGTPAQKSDKAFKSLMIIMGTTAATMLIVGPAIWQYSDPTDSHVSVFTQTMDQILPGPLSLIGTLIGVLVLMSASAASAQGLQNLALGLKSRRYIPPVVGEQNEFQVADKPVWIEVAIVVFCFLAFGTSEDTYLAIYAAGVFILLSMTGWAVTKRLLREIRLEFSMSKIGLIMGTVMASLLTSTATIIIFQERFTEGAWTYFLFIPTLYTTFTYFRNRLGTPSEDMDYLGRFDAYQLAGFGFGQGPLSFGASVNGGVDQLELGWQPDPIEKSIWREKHIEIERIAVLLDGSDYAALAIPVATKVANATKANLTFLSSVKNHTQAFKNQYKDTVAAREAYLKKVTNELKGNGVKVESAVRPGFIANATKGLVNEKDIDLVITSTRGKSGSPNWETGGVSNELVRKITRPVLLVQTTDHTNGKVPDMKRILIALDGSIFSERVLPYARLFAKVFNSELILLAVPAVPMREDYRAPGNVVEMVRSRAEINMRNFLDAVARSLRQDGVNTRIIVAGSIPVRTIVSVGIKEDVSLIMLTSQGRGGLDLFFTGSVAEEVVAESPNHVFMVPIHEPLE